MRRQSLPPLIQSYVLPVMNPNNSKVFHQDYPLNSSYAAYLYSRGDSELTFLIVKQSTYSRRPFFNIEAGLTSRKMPTNGQGGSVQNCMGSRFIINSTNR
jgi:hypothetical protein